MINRESSRNVQTIPHRELHELSFSFNKISFLSLFLFFSPEIARCRASTPMQSVPRACSERASSSRLSPGSILGVKRGFFTREGPSSARQSGIPDRSPRIYPSEESQLQKGSGHRIYTRALTRPFVTRTRSHAHNIYIIYIYNKFLYLCNIYLHTLYISYIYI